MFFFFFKFNIIIIVVIGTAGHSALDSGELDGRLLRNGFLAVRRFRRGHRPVGRIVVPGRLWRHRRAVIRRMVRHRLLAGVVGGLVRGHGSGAVHGMELLTVAGVVVVSHRVVRGRGGGAAQVLKRTDHHDGVLFPVVSRANNQTILL